MKNPDSSARSPVGSGVRTALAVIGLLIALWLIVQLRALLALLLIATVLATGIHPVVEWLHARRWSPNAWQLPRWLVILSVLLIIVSAVGGLFFFLGSVLWNEGTQAWNDLPSYTSGLNKWLDHLRNQFPQIPSQENLLATAQKEAGKIGQYFWKTTSAAFGVLGGFLSGLTVLVLTFYMLLERGKLRSVFGSFIPPAHRDQVVQTTEEALLTMGGWLRGQTILVFAMTALITGVMAALGLPHPLLLGIVGGIGELIPMVGPIAAGFIAVPIAFAFMPLWVGVVSLVFFVLLSILEGNVIVPKVMQKNVDLSPFTTVVAVLVGGSLAGVIGALLALPLSAALRIYIKRLVLPKIQQ